MCVQVHCFRDHYNESFKKKHVPGETIIDVHVQVENVWFVEMWTWECALLNLRAAAAESVQPTHQLNLIVLNLNRTYCT